MSTSAEAGLLKGGLEVGDRSRIHIAAVPGPGEPRFVPRAEPEVVQSHVELGVARKSDPDAETGPAPSARGSARGDAPETRPAKPLLRHILEQFPNEIAAAAEKHKVSEALILAVIAIESAGRPHVRSHAGAEGLMQLIPATAKRFGITDSFDPSQNIDAGAAYLSWLLKTFNGNLPLVLAGYNAGEGAVRKYGGVPPYRETRDYVAKVKHALAGAEEICRAVGLAPEARIRRWQDWLTPAWSYCCGNCHLNRPTASLVEESGFRMERLETGYARGPKPMAFMYEGLARSA